MAKLSLLISAIFCFLVFFFNGCCLAQMGSKHKFFWQKMNEQQQHRLYAKTNCTILRLSAQEPVFKYEFEAGVSEFWNQFSPEFTCAGVEAVRNVINPKGLMLPHYNAAPQLMYIVQGRGVHGVVIPGCAETYESEMESGSGGFMDRHQKVREFKEGDVIALPGGLTIWIYNHGEVPVVTVSLFDVSNEANQLDRTFRIFFLAGNYPILGKERPRQQVQKEGGFGNIFTSFDDELLADSFNVDKETASELKGKGDHRGRIVLAESFKIAIPREEEEKRGANGLEETLCTMKIRENLAEPSEADIFNPRGGLISTLNSQKLHILNSLQLSAERGVMYGNAIMAPHWHVNAHSMIYITQGSSRFQVANHQGKLVFDGEVKEGQIILVPQNFVVLKKAGKQGCEWVAFKTNDNAMTTFVAGRLSAIRAMPVEVLMNSYQISRNDAKKLKYSREELGLFGSKSRTEGPRAI